jgi:hypothetical protein
MTRDASEVKSPPTPAFSSHSPKASREGEPLVSCGGPGYPAVPLSPATKQDVGRVPQPGFGGPGLQWNRGRRLELREKVAIRKRVKAEGHRERKRARPPELRVQYSGCGAGNQPRSPRPPATLRELKTAGGNIP